MTRIVLADAHASDRDALRAQLELRGHALVGLAEDGQEALRLTWAEEPDVLALDLDTPRVDYRRAAAGIVERGLATRVLLLGRFETGSSVLDAFRSGIGACVQRSHAGTELAAAIDQLARGSCYLSPGLAKRAVRRFQHGNEADGVALTPPELDVLSEVVRDVPRHQIARRLNLTQPSVERHYTSIKNKLRAAHIGSLVRYAVRHRLSGPPRP